MTINSYSLFQNSYQYAASAYAAKVSDGSDTKTQQRTGEAVADKLSGDGFTDIHSVQYKLAKEKTFETALENAKISNPIEYERLLAEQKKAGAKTLEQVIASRDETNIATYNGVAIYVDTQNNQLCVGDMDNGRVLSVQLSNGFTLKFNRDNIDQIAGMLDLFSPEDIRKIMEAITIDNMTAGTEEANKELKNSVGSTDTSTKAEHVEEAETTSEIMVNADGSRVMLVTTKIGNMQTVTSIELAPATEENQFSDEPQKNVQEETGTPALYHMALAANAYESNFTYA